jgi:hypothetical protein
MAEFYPHQLTNFDAEDRDHIADLEDTDQGEPVQVYKGAVECDLLVYVDSVQIPLNGGHKSVAVGLGTYDSIASHHHPKMTAEVPHVMQPDGSHMHSCIERLSHVIQRHCRIMVMEAAMNNATYPFHVRYLGKPNARCNVVERVLKGATPAALGLLPEAVRQKILAAVKGAYAPVAIHTGAIDAVHEKTLEVLGEQLTISSTRQYDTMVFGLPDLSPYSVNWFYHKPLIRKNGVVIILNPVFEIFHDEYHVAYKQFYEEVLSVTNEPFEMKERFQEKFARDPHLIDCYRNRFAHHGFHPFTVWYWATYALTYLSKVILVGPSDDGAAKKLGVDWSPNLDHALGVARDITGGDDVVGLTVPPFFYCRVD